MAAHLSDGQYRMLLAYHRGERTHGSVVTFQRLMSLGLLDTGKSLGERTRLTPMGKRILAASTKLRKLLAQAELEAS